MRVNRNLYIEAHRTVPVRMSTFAEGAARNRHFGVVSRSPLLSMKNAASKQQKASAQVTHGLVNEQHGLTESGRF